MQDLSLTYNLDRAKEQVSISSTLLFDMNNTILYMDKVDWYSYRVPLLKNFNIVITYRDYLQYAGARRGYILQKLYKDKMGKDLNKDKLRLLIKQGREFKSKVLLSQDFKNMVHLLPGIKEFLAWAKNNNKNLAVVTSTSKRYTPLILKSAGLYDFFDGTITADDVFCGKPCAEPFVKGAELFGVQSKDTIVFEDSFPGIEAGKSAGAFVIGVLTPGRNDKAVKNADAIITDFRQLM